MDIASKIKLTKEEIQKLDEQQSVMEDRIKELKTLVESKKKKESKIEELKKMEAELLASL